MQLRELTSDSENEIDYALSMILKSHIDYSSPDMNI